MVAWDIVITVVPIIPATHTHTSIIHEQEVNLNQTLSIDVNQRGLQYIERRLSEHIRTFLISWSNL